MTQTVATKLADAVRVFNLRAKRARRKGLPFIIESNSGDVSNQRAIHLDILRSRPSTDNLPPDAQDDQCTAEVALLNATEELNRLSDEAWRKNLKVVLKVEPQSQRPGDSEVKVVLPNLL